MQGLSKRRAGGEWGEWKLEGLKVSLTLLRDGEGTSAFGLNFPLQFWFLINFLSP